MTLDEETTSDISPELPSELPIVAAPSMVALPQVGNLRLELSNVSSSNRNSGSYFWFSFCMLTFVVSGLPALLLLEFYKFLHIAEVLSLLTVTNHSVFILLYIYTCGAGIAILLPLLMYSGIKMAKPKCTLAMNENGLQRLPSGRVYDWYYKYCVLALAKLEKAILRDDSETCHCRGLCPNCNPIPWKNISTVKFDANQFANEERLVIKVKDGYSFNVPLDGLDRKHRIEIEKTLRHWLRPAQITGSVSHFQVAPKYSKRITDTTGGSRFDWMKKLRFTDLWFSQLIGRNRKTSSDLLPSGTQLQNTNIRILSPIGTGGLANVYLAEQFLPDHVDAKKIVLKEFILTVDESDSSAVNQSKVTFSNELQVLEKLNNPNIVKCSGNFIEDHRAYLILDFIEGVSLQDYIVANGRLAEDEAIQLTIQMCRMLSYLHSIRIVHRDFTPHNLLLQRDGNLKLIDFNTALHAYRKPDERDDVVGKPDYISPEQFRGRATAQSDIYALGATMFFILTGEAPEPITQSKPKSFRSDLSDEIDRIVAQATALNVSDRYLDADLLLADILVI